MREGGFVGDVGGATRLKRRMVERVLTRCADETLGDIEPLMTLLRRFAAEAAREEARLFCDELVAGYDDEPYEARRGLACGGVLSVRRASAHPGWQQRKSAGSERRLARRQRRREEALEYSRAARDFRAPGNRR